MTKVSQSLIQTVPMPRFVNIIPTTFGVRRRTVVTPLQIHVMGRPTGMHTKVYTKCYLLTQWRAYQASHLPAVTMHTNTCRLLWLVVSHGALVTWAEAESTINIDINISDSSLKVTMRNHNEPGLLKSNHKFHVTMNI